MPDEGRLAEVLDVFDLGPGTLSGGPVATGRLGEIWRFDTAFGSWAVKTTTGAVGRVELLPQGDRGARAPG